MIPLHVLFANPDRFDLETFAKFYQANKEWVAHCDTVKENIIKKTFERYQVLHGVSITSSNTLFRLIPLKHYLQHILDLKEGRIPSFPKTLPNILVSKCKKMTMNQVYPTLVLLIKLQMYMANELLYVDEKDVYPYQLLNVIMIYQAIEKICVEHQFEDLLNHKTFLQATIDKCHIILEETKHQAKKMNRETKYVYSYCVRYIRRVKRMLVKLKSRQ